MNLRTYLRARPWTAVLLLLWLLGLAAPCILLALYGDPRLGLPGAAAAYGLLTLLALAALLCWRPALFVLINLGFAALAPFEALYIALFQSTPGYEIFASTLESSLAEAVEMAGWTRVLLLWSASLGMVVLGLYLSWRLWPVRGGRRHAVIAVCAAVLVAPQLYRVQWIVRGSLAAQEAKAAAGAISTPRGLEVAAQSFPLGVVIRASVLAAESRRLAQMRAAIADFRFSARQDARAAQAEQLHVVVIGETARAANWQPNGYARETAPRLTARDSIVHFTDLISHWNITRRAVPQLLTRRDPRVASDAFPESSVLTAFKEAGFHTVWLSNQRRVGPHDSLIGLYVREADESQFVGLGHWKQRDREDGALLAPLAQTLARHPRGDLLIVLHLMGSHYHYGHRLPPGYRVPWMDAAAATAVDNLDRSDAPGVLDAYDASLRYTDEVLDTVIRALEADGRAATLSYISDHGEDLRSGTCPLANHGNPTVYNYRVPGFVWYSDSYAQRFPERVTALIAHGSARLASSQMFSTWLGLAGIEFPGFDPRKDISSQVFEPTVRWVNTPEPVDFDRARLVGACQRVEAAGS